MSAQGTDLTIVAFIVIPVGLALLAACVGAFRALISGGKYLAKNETSMDELVKSNAEIAGSLQKYIDKTDVKLEEHGRTLAVHAFQLDRLDRQNGVTRERT